MENRNDWDCKKDFELLHERMDKFSTEVTLMLREAISPFLVNSASCTTGTKRARYDLPEDAVQTIGPRIGKLAPFSELTANSGIRKIICLLVQFESYAMKEAEGENTLIHQNISDNKTPKIKTAGEEVVGPGLSLEKFQSVLRAFESYFRSMLASQEPDPLGNPLILQKILSYNLNAKDLKSFALINKVWHSISVSVIRSAHERINLSKIDLPTFIDVMQNSSMFPYTKFKVNLSPDGQHHFAEIGTFFKIFGEHVVDLNIEAGTVDPLNDDEEEAYLNSAVEDDQLVSIYWQALKDVLRSVPNLAAVHFSTVPVSFNAEPVFFSEVFNNLILPKVKRLILDSPANLSAEFLTGIFGTVPELTSLQLRYLPENQDYVALATSISSLKRLTELKIVPAPHIFWDTLAVQDLHFKRLDMYLINTTTDEDQLALKKYLLAQKDSLERLQITAGAREGTSLRMPAMSKLKDFIILYLQGTGEGEQEHYYYDLLQLAPTQLPAVKFISACAKCFTGAFQRPGQFCVYESVEKLLLKRLPLPRDAEESAAALPQVDEFQKISSMLPNLKSLIISNEYQPVGLHADDLATLFKSFQNLSSLYLHLSQHNSIQDINYVLSGIPYVYEPIVGQVMDKKDHPEFDTVLVPMFCSGEDQPSLRDMKALKNLSINFEPQGNNHTPPISGLSVHMTFLRMQSLNKLDLRGNVLISDADSLKLSKHHKNVFVYAE